MRTPSLSVPLGDSTAALAHLLSGLGLPPGFGTFPLATRVDNDITADLRACGHPGRWPPRFSSRYAERLTIRGAGWR
ncbi:MAG: hypothetical protein FJ102_12160 [Deltaproteobacteria bacterium]|nr:hypothetical protein [Deltaproteobacteria bacterium]